MGGCRTRKVRGFVRGCTTGGIRGGKTKGDESGERAHDPRGHRTGGDKRVCERV